ncbi:unnamed protein product, partial [Trichobilharzia regenti]
MVNCSFGYYQPHYGDKLHRISGEIYGVSNCSQTGSDRSSKRSGSPVNPLGNVNLIARVSGGWNKTIDFEVFSKVVSLDYDLPKFHNSSNDNINNSNNNNGLINNK